jgi:hypothetical protein
LSPLRFGVLGSHPRRVSILGRRVVERLRRAGAHLAVWLQGEADAALPCDADRRSPIEDFATWGVPVLPRESQAALAGTGVDFLLQLDDTRPSDAVLESPRRGVWRFATSSPGPLVFWDVLDGACHLELRLERLTSDPCRRVPLDRRWIRVERRSYGETLEAAIAELVQMAVQAALSDAASRAEPVAFPPGRMDPPSALDRARLRWRLLWRNAASQLAGLLFTESWRIGVVDVPIARFLDFDYLPSIRWLPSPAGWKDLADPFLAATAEGTLLLAEDYDQGKRRGKIVGELAADAGFTGRLSDAIVEDCHMSYPFLLRHDGELYCIPETHQKRGAFAWRWSPQARAWIDPRAILTGVPCVDPTPVFFDRRWWLFFTHKDDGVDSKLRLCFAGSPLGPWHPHPRNPVKCDVRSSRPAGTPFVYRDHLYRPAQDCSRRYGWRLVLNRVTRLTETEFAEEPLRVLDSDRLGVRGIHTLSGAGGITALDAQSCRFTPWRLPRVLATKTGLLLSRARAGAS